MNDVFSIAESGLRAAQFSLSVASDNIANADTPGYQARRPDLVDLSGGGAAAAGTTADPSPGPTLPDGTQGSNVDLATESVSMIQARLLYTANAVVLRTADKMYGTLLNVLEGDDNRTRGGT